MNRFKDLRNFSKRPRNRCTNVENICLSIFIKKYIEIYIKSDVKKIISIKKKIFIEIKKI